MTYKAAMDFLALGVKTVQFCTIATKFGYGIIRDLESGTAFLMQERGIRSMKELIGIEDVGGNGFSNGGTEPTKSTEGSRGGSAWAALLRRAVSRSKGDPFSPLASLLRVRIRDLDCLPSLISLPNLPL